MTSFYAALNLLVEFATQSHTQSAIMTIINKPTFSLTPSEGMILSWNSLKLILQRCFISLETNNSDKIDKTFACGILYLSLVSSGKTTNNLLLYTRFSFQNRIQPTLVKILLKFYINPIVERDNTAFLGGI